MTNRYFRTLGFLLALFCLSCAFAQQRALAQGSEPRSPADIEKLVAPIALYPDPLIAQVLPAATYPDQLLDAAAWVQAHPDGSGLDQQPWEPSVTAIAHYPAVLDLMTNSIDWTRDLGSVFINQQTGVMDAIQRLRKEAENAGNLTSNVHQSVDVDNNEVRIAPANPSIMYVPSYDPSVVYDQPAPEDDWNSPFVTFGLGYPLGAWLDLDCDWYDHRVFFHGSRGGWGDWYFHHGGRDAERSIGFNRRSPGKPWSYNSPKYRPPARTQPISRGAAAFSSQGGLRRSAGASSDRGWGEEIARAPAPLSHGTFSRSPGAQAAIVHGNAERPNTSRVIAPEHPLFRDSENGGSAWAASNRGHESLERSARPPSNAGNFGGNHGTSNQAGSGGSFHGGGSGGGSHGGGGGSHGGGKR